MDNITNKAVANVLDCIICRNKGIDIYSNLQEVADALHKEYGLIAQAVWLPNLSVYGVILRSVYFKPKEICANFKEISKNLNQCRELFKIFDNPDYYTALRFAIYVAEFYILRVMYESTNDPMYLKILDKFDIFKFSDRLHVCFELDVNSNLKETIDIAINYNNGNDSIKDRLKDFIKLLEYEDGCNSNEI